MDIIKDNELIYVNDKKRGINSCGYNVNCLLFNSGISPILTMNNASENNKSSSTISSLFENLVVPNWALHYEPNNSKIDSKIEDDSTFEIVDDNLYDKLMDLAIYKDPFFTNDNETRGGKRKHTKTKSKSKNNNTIIDKNKNKNKKNKRTRKK
jgi:hypothetical protein